VVAVGEGNSVVVLTDPSSSLQAHGFLAGINEAGQTSFPEQHLTEIAPGSCESGPECVNRGEIGAITKIADESIFDEIGYGGFSQLDEARTVTLMGRGAVRNGIYQGSGTEGVFADYAVAEEEPSGTAPPYYDGSFAVCETLVDPQGCG